MPRPAATPKYISSGCVFFMFSSTANIVFKHKVSDTNLTTTDGSMTSCLPETKTIKWQIEFGSRLRVAVVFLRVSKPSVTLKANTTIEGGSGEFSVYFEVLNFILVSESAGSFCYCLC